MKKLPGMRNVIVICANQMDLIRICRYLSYFHGGNLVVFSSKSVFDLFENLFSGMFHHSRLPPQIHVVFQHKRLNSFILVKNGNQTEWSVTKN